MKRALMRLISVGVILGVWLAVLKWKDDPVRPETVPATRSNSQPPVLELLPARLPTPENPASSWERLLAADGTPIEDRAALEDIVTNYLQSARDNVRLPLGTNDEITRALMDRNTLGESAIPTGHPAIISGQLVDRWGSPWWFHQLAADVIEVRSAGPDRRLFSADDVVK